MGELSSPWDEAMDEITTLRAQVTRRDEEISDLRHEIESARDAARGENDLRLDAERERDEASGSLEKQREYTKLAMGERDTLRAQVERWVKEVAHLKLAAERAEREKALFDAATETLRAEVWRRDHGEEGVMGDSELAILHESLAAHPLNKAEIGEEEIAVLRAITEHWEKAVAHLHPTGGPRR